MASYQYVYHMDGVSKTYPGGKKCFENIRLSFLPGVKIGVVGVNGSGKSTLMRIMAGLDKDFTGEAWAAEGARVGYLPGGRGPRGASRPIHRRGRVAWWGERLLEYAGLHNTTQLIPRAANDVQSGEERLHGPDHRGSEAHRAPRPPRPL